jgi:hypothetical protein
MQWPTRSSELNLIEHLWAALDKRIKRLPNLPTTLHQLSLALTQVWEEIKQRVIQNLILSMRQCCAAGIKARGGNTQY